MLCFLVQMFPFSVHQNQKPCRNKFHSRSFGWATCAHEASTYNLQQSTVRMYLRSTYLLFSTQNRSKHPHTGLYLRIEGFFKEEKGIGGINHNRKHGWRASLTAKQNQRWIDFSNDNLFSTNADEEMDDYGSEGENSSIGSGRPNKW